jgi:hypothetical protein
MFTKENILDQLNSGKSIEAIAAELTDALNAANDEYVAAQSKAATRQKKEEIALAFNDLLVEYAKIECPDVVPMMEMQAEDVDILIKTFDEMFNAFNMVVAFEQKMKASNTSSPKSDDDVLSDFISKLLS